MVQSCGTKEASLHCMWVLYCCETALRNWSIASYMAKLIAVCLPDICKFSQNAHSLRRHFLLLRYVHAVQTWSGSSTRHHQRSWFPSPCSLEIRMWDAFTSSCKVQM